MMRALPPILLAALPAAVPAGMSAQGLECTFTLVCAPQIDCVAHDGVPFSLTLRDGGALGFDRDGDSYSARPQARDGGGPLTLLFEDGAGSLLFTLSDAGSAVLTEHRVTDAGRVEHSSFSGTCEVM